MTPEQKLAYKNCMKDVNNRVLLQLYDRILNLLEKENLKNIKASENTENIKYNFDSIEKNNNFAKIIIGISFVQ